MGESLAIVVVGESEVLAVTAPAALVPVGVFGVLAVVATVAMVLQGALGIVAVGKSAYRLCGRPVQQSGKIIDSRGKRAPGRKLMPCTAIGKRHAVFKFLDLERNISSRHRKYD